MFDVGFSEMLVIAIVALVVIGPERLPRVARTAGALLRKARNSWQSVRSDIERELAAEDIKRTMQQTAAQIDPMPDIRRMSQAPPSAPSAGSADPAPPQATPRDDDAGHERH